MNDTALPSSPHAVASKAVGGGRKRKAGTDAASAASVAAATDAGTGPGVAGATAKRARVGPRRMRQVINAAPTEVLDVFVFGEGTAGQLGLGSASGDALQAQAPRRNEDLAAELVGVVQVSVGARHCAALTHDNRILTWGANGLGELGRRTDWPELLDVGEHDESLEPEELRDAPNPQESTPLAVPSSAFPEGTNFASVVCGESSTFAFTDEGNVYGWGTFKANEGVIGFRENIFIARTPVHIPELKQITAVAIGAHHAMALSKKGRLFIWGSAQQHQLGRRAIQRTRRSGLTPREFRISRVPVVAIACGAFHSFALDSAGRVWAWGLNVYGETGVTFDGGGHQRVPLVPTPTVVQNLRPWRIVALSAGVNHSLAITEDGDCLAWGRMDGFQTGIDMANLHESDIVRDKKGRPRYLTRPIKVPVGDKARMVTAHDHTSLLISRDGLAYAWGYSGEYQTGLGTNRDIEVPKVVWPPNEWLKSKFSWAGLGERFGVLVAPAHKDDENNSYHHSPVSDSTNQVQC